MLRWRRQNKRRRTTTTTKMRIVGGHKARLRRNCQYCVYNPFRYPTSVRWRPRIQRHAWYIKHAMVAQHEIPINEATKTTIPYTSNVLSLNSSRRCRGVYTLQICSYTDVHVYRTMRWRLYNTDTVHDNERLQIIFITTHALECVSFESVRIKLYNYIIHSSGVHTTAN